MRKISRRDGEERSSALWGKRSGSRGSASRGKGVRALATVLLALVAGAGPAAAVADARPAKGAKAKHADRYRAFVTPPLLQAAKANPRRAFAVIVQGDLGTRPRQLERLVERGKGRGKAPTVKRQFEFISGVSVRLTGERILLLAKLPGVEAITSDAPIGLTNYSNRQKWAYVAGIERFWRPTARGEMANPPAIAIVDSGIDKGRIDFRNADDTASRVIHEEVMTPLTPNAPGDGRGHGTFVAGIAAGSAPKYTGTLPNAPLVSLDVMDDKGMARTSDVIAAAEWIHENKARFNIRVANFSLHSGAQNSFMYDPLNKAVEKLWFGGVVVVAAAGNYGSSGEPSGVPFAPGNDPFVITVGASDIDGSVGVNDDAAAPWSAYGYTLDGFAKPDLGAPGRYMIGPVPPNSTLAQERPDQVRAPGYIELSGTSFAAPLVAGIAAYVLAEHPTWTPDQVKGALMLTAKALRSAEPGSLGVGEVDGPRAADVVDPPNPNLALNRFLVADPAGRGGVVFDAESWASTAKADASWASASWASASWASASWASASWASASWASASWASASWASTAEAQASWASASWASTSYEDNAKTDPAIGGEMLTPEEEAALLAEARAAD
jgi:serine protease AprX